MDKKLLATKRFISDEFLGKHGIHSVGISQVPRAVVVYAEDDESLSPELRRSIRGLAGLVRVIFRVTNRAGFHGIARQKRISRVRSLTKVSDRTSRSKQFG